ncbi:MAG TPA: M20 family metallo-hydrolase [Acidobacteriaceae bacterium]|nr:M20 family metallo-hydrolase [Acidobacteriaceae bacterium]
MHIDMARLSGEIDALALISDAEAPAVTRVVFSERDREGRAWLKARFGEAGLAIREDAVGNVFAHWEGRDATLPAVATGSHIDAIPFAGKYDGVVGVLGALEAIRSLKQSGFAPSRSIELIQFTAEEPTRFGIGCLGSRLMSGVLAADGADDLRDAEGQSLHELRARAGFSGELAEVRMQRGHYAGFVELHIEQGPNLEREGVAIGAVTHIAAPATLRITFEGEGGHAGAKLMPGRRDAFCAAAEAVLAVERAALSTGAVDTVGTVGICEIHPGAINSIPSRVKIAADIRDIDGTRRDVVVNQIRAAIDEIAKRRNVSAMIETVNADPPTASSPQILEAIERACATESVSHTRMVARAYHDTSFMAGVCPVAMIFIPCRGGVSHRPDEYASPEAIDAGVRVLARTLADLAG